MVLFNYSTKELTAKVVYYGPGLCGKTTNLQFVHQNLSDNVKGKMLSLATKTDRTLFFDFLPMDLGEIRGMKTRMQLYTVPGQVFYNETRKLVLKGVDGLVFIADSQKEMLNPNVESFKNLEENLKAHGLKLAEMPHVIQYNKRDLPKLSSIEELNAALNKYNAPFYESVATTGIGVQDTLKAITKLVLLHLTKKYDPRATPSTRPTTVAVGAPQPPEVPAASVPVGAPVPAAPAVGVPAAESIPLAGSGPTETTTAQPTASLAGAGAATSTTSADQPPVTTLDGDEIDDLVNEVQDSEGPDKGADVTTETPAQSPPPIQVAVEAVPSDDPAVRLTDTICDGDLFNDPSLEVAHLVAGEMREIIIPVQVGAEESAVRRYKLSLRMRLDPVE